MRPGELISDGALLAADHAGALALLRADHDSKAVQVLETMLPLCYWRSPYGLTWAVRVETSLAAEGAVGVHSIADAYEQILLARGTEVAGVEMFMPGAAVFSYVLIPRSLRHT